ncbi:MAG: type II toxin-antitoxin system VapC family toxin [Chloroflexi bacterium]|nr:type II toxin-antitoxin system VapC family toxin [Ardenticatenaceae bacterium]MBL1131508.1 PIN domain-containing protein [Chloroflexota bacterium]NOG37619.1 type II toxin-antitoxin system VapC family toxin [Chloroflexota bacterium]GIK55597.1 MAG: hypothetical protein BroJett015_12600 [Chloroflexota bacterium]
MDREIFVDTAYAIALSSPKDLFHPQAVRFAQKLKADKIKLVMTRAVMLEIDNALSKLQYRHASVQLWDALEADPHVGIVPLAETFFPQAMNLYRNRIDKEWGLVDCNSFVVMEERGIAAALTTDLHFQQAGFQVLLRE